MWPINHLIGVSIDWASQRNPDAIHQDNGEISQLSKQMPRSTVEDNERSNFDDYQNLSSHHSPVCHGGGGKIDLEGGSALLISAFSQHELHSLSYSINKIICRARAFGTPQYGL